MHIGILFILVISSLFLSGCGTTNYAPLDTVTNVDINRYMGKWYEVARLPFDRQANCTCTTAEYAIIDSQTIRVTNTCYDTTENKISTAEGKAFALGNTGNAKLKVQFFWPFKGDYWILDLDTTNYRWAVIGMPSRKYAWILSRTPQLDAVIFENAKNKLTSTGFATDRLIFTKQAECK